MRNALKYRTILYKLRFLGLTWQPVGLEGNRLQIRLAGPYFAAFLVNRTTIDLQNRQVG